MSFYSVYDFAFNGINLQYGGHYSQIGGHKVMLRFPDILNQYNGDHDIENADHLIMRINELVLGNTWKLSCSFNGNVIEINKEDTTAINDLIINKTDSIIFIIDVLKTTLTADPNAEKNILSFLTLQDAIYMLSSTKNMQERHNNSIIEIKNLKLNRIVLDGIRTNILFRKLIVRNLELSIDDESLYPQFIEIITGRNPLYDITRLESIVLQGNLDYIQRFTLKQGSNALHLELLQKSGQGVKVIILHKIEDITLDNIGLTFIDRNRLNRFRPYNDIPIKISVKSLYLDIPDIGLCTSVLSNAEPWLDLSNVTELRIRHSPITDLNSLLGHHEFKSLRILQLLNCEHLIDISGLQTVSTDLKYIEISSINKLTDISVLERFVNLKTLRISECSSITNYTCLRSLTNLKDLNVYKSHFSSADLNLLPRSLTVLNLVRTQVIECDPLAGLQKLTELSLAHTQVVDCRPLSALQQLTKLTLAHTPVVDCRPLSALQQLTELDLEHTQVVDCSPLAALSQLRILNLSHTHIVDLMPLSALHLLFNLDISYLQLNSITVAQITELFGNMIDLEGIILSHTSITIDQVEQLLSLLVPKSLRYVGLNEGALTEQQIKSLNRKYAKYAIFYEIVNIIYPF